MLEAKDTLFKNKADFEIGADIILNEYLSDPKAAYIKYGGKIILLEGRLDSQIPVLLMANP